MRGQFVSCSDGDRKRLFKKQYLILPENDRSIKAAANRSY